MATRKEFFNLSAATWDQYYLNPKLLSFVERIILELDFESGQKVLDIGSGTGILVPFLANAVGSTGHITAIDYAEKMVEACKAKYSNLENVTILVQDVEKLQFDSESIDAVVCFGLFPHLENKFLALQLMHRVLRRGGRLIIAHAMSSEEIKLRHNSSSPVVAQDVLPEAGGMKALLSQVGFSDIRIKDEPGVYLCLSFKLQGSREDQE